MHDALGRLPYGDCITLSHSGLPDYYRISICVIPSPLAVSVTLLLI